MTPRATGEARLREEETIWGGDGSVAGLDWELRGAVRAVYFLEERVQTEAMPAEQLRGEVAVTQFGRMCQKLGIRILGASSPQAKGRVEGDNGIHQDRLIKKTRRQGIASFAAANQYLEKQYLPEHNRRFARVAAQAEDHRTKTKLAGVHQVSLRYRSLATN
jgi:hypothetical protein